MAKQTPENPAFLNEFRVDVSTTGLTYCRGLSTNKITSIKNGDTSGVYRDSYKLSEFYVRNLDIVTTLEAESTEETEATENTEDTENTEVTEKNEEVKENKETEEEQSTEKEVDTNTKDTKTDGANASEIETKIQTKVELEVGYDDEIANPDKNTDTSTSSSPSTSSSSQSSTGNTGTSTSTTNKKKYNFDNSGFSEGVRQPSGQSNAGNEDLSGITRVPWN